MTILTLSDAYSYCQDVAAKHYENFPVASCLLPRRFRQPIAVIYAFARTADDFADEGNLTPAERLQLLDDYETRLQRLLAGAPGSDPVFIALTDVIKRYALPIGLFEDLLSAFSQDVTKQRYENFAEVMDYCRRSANPVGRLLLFLYNQADEENLSLSDQICTALQLINFLQDLLQDFDEHNRIYLPQDEMRKYQICEADLRERNSNTAMQDLVQLQVQRARALLLAGSPLGNKLAGRIGLELRMIIQGGMRILQKLENNGGNVFLRPRLKKSDYLSILWNAMLNNPL
ncbi:MAG: squalene synthase HpnC [Gammaproteobacteria bacterium]|nr:squalene synthase HpnC [Gammaproteobacteria bacterium]